MQRADQHIALDLAENAEVGLAMWACSFHHVVANLDLELFDSSGTFMYTVGDFASSLRQSSLSTTYNYEHLYLTNLAAGNYTFRIKGDLATDYGFSWRITTAIPEPSGAIILGLALTASLIRRRRQA